MDVGAARGFADRVQMEPAQIRFQAVEGLEVRGAFARPFGQAQARRSDLYEAVRHNGWNRTRGYQGAVPPLIFAPWDGTRRFRDPPWLCPVGRHRNTGR